jgi:ribonuclease T1
MSNGTRQARTGQRSLVGLIIALITAGLVWLTQGYSHTPVADPDSGLPIVKVADLPPEAAKTLSLIDAGGPYPYDTDGITFENREGILPAKDEGYYREYTVETPGSDDRGARRIVTGSNGELYWTDDHYSSFSRIAR